MKNHQSQHNFRSRAKVGACPNKDCTNDGHRIVAVTGFSRDQQEGIVLVVVLLMILLLATASVITIKQSQVALDITTASQVKQLLWQASDVPLAHFERALKDPEQMQAMASAEGPIGYLAGQSDAMDSVEYVICYQPTVRKTLYTEIGRHRIIRSSDPSIHSKGYCNIAASSENYFTSNRKVVATQVSFIRPASLTSITTNSQQSVVTVDNQNENGIDNNEFDDGSAAVTNNEVDNDVAQQAIHIRVYVTSIMPILSHASLSEVAACMRQPMVDFSGVNIGQQQNQRQQQLEGQVACLERTQTPYDIKVQDYYLEPSVIFGK